MADMNINSVGVNFAANTLIESGTKALDEAVKQINLKETKKSNENEQVEIMFDYDDGSTYGSLKARVEAEIEAAEEQGIDYTVLKQFPPKIDDSKP